MLQQDADSRPPQSPKLNVWRMARLGSFQIGSAMGDILVTSIWNRVMISNFGIPAWPVGLLIALRYFLSPLSLWAGHRSDSQKLWGYYRTSYIWLGRGMMLASLPLLGLSLLRLEVDQADPLGWGLALICFGLYGVGTLLSGSPFLALVRDSAPREKQGLAISIAETTLIIFFALAGIGFSLWMRQYSAAVFWEMIALTMGLGGFFWFVGILGVERESIPPAVREGNQTAASATDFVHTFRQIWADSRTRRFFVFLSLATLAAWTQDVILEPFGAEVLGRSLDQTTRFNSYWQGATVVTLISAAVVWRKRPAVAQTNVTAWGLRAMALGLGLLALESLLGGVHLLEVALLVFGGGFGVYTFGGLSLMAVMSSDTDAGAYLGLWTISILIFKGLGNFTGSLLRDVFLGLGLAPGLAYGITFFLAAVGLMAATFVLSGLDVAGFARDTGRVMDKRELQAAGIEL